MHNLTGNDFLSGIVRDLKMEHKELLYFLSLQIKPYQHLIQKRDAQAPLTLREKEFIELYEDAMNHQSSTISAISAFQEFLDVYPDAKLKNLAQQRLFDLQDKLVMKELHSAQLYYNLGTYFGNCTSGGNNYEACIVTSENALKDYPFMSKREDFSVLIMKSKYELARQSVESKKLERFQDAEDECYGFLNEFPDSKERPLAEKYIAKCKEVTKD